MNTNRVCIGIVGAIIMVDSWKTYLIVRNMWMLGPMTTPPPELELPQETFDTTKARTMDECTALALNSFIDMHVTIAKLVFNYFPFIWEQTARFADTTTGRAVCFTVMDFSINYAATIPVEFLMALFLGMDNAIIELISNAAMLAIKGSFIAVATYAFIYVADNYGVQTVAESLLVINALGAVYMALFFKFVVPRVMSPLPDSDAGKSVRELASSVGYPSQIIYINKNDAVPNAYYHSVLVARCITISGSLMTMLEAPQVTAVVAHELGHWRYRHQAFHIASSLFRLSALSYTLMYAYGNTTIGEIFQMDPNAHPFIPLYLTGFFIWRLFAQIYDGLMNIFNKHFEYSADTYACKVWNPKNLRQAIVKLSASSKTVYILDSWYVAWFIGHPPPLMRIREILKKENK